MSSFGKIFKVTTRGESHCPSVGCIVDGVPSGLQLSENDIQPQMNRRRPGQSALTTPRDEKDKVIIESGVENGITLGSPIGLRVNNEDHRPKDYGASTMDLFPRPSHADYTYQMKYGIRASSGGGRSSARETIGRVAAGAIAEKLLKEVYGVDIVSFVYSVGDEELFPPTPTHPSASLNPTYLKMLETITREEVDRYVPVRCPNQEASDRMARKIAEFRDKQDSIGGTVVCVIRNVPVGLGEPCFDKLEAILGQAMLSIPATKGFEIGSGFAGCTIPGSKHNDAFVKGPAVPPSQSGADAVTNGTHANGSAPSPNRPSSNPFPILKTRTNNSGGVQGGISNGAPIYFRVAFKPPATIGQAQETSTFSGTAGTLEAKGRHDPCVVPRAVPIVEAMAALTIIDACMAQEARTAFRSRLTMSGGPIEPEEDKIAAYPS